MIYVSRELSRYLINTTSNIKTIIRNLQTHHKGSLSADLSYPCTTVLLTCYSQTVRIWNVCICPEGRLVF